MLSPTAVALCLCYSAGCCCPGAPAKKPQKSCEPLPLRPRQARGQCRRCGGNVVSSHTVLETEQLTKDFAGFVAVRGVNLRVARGSIHAMIGPNGAGKTT